MISILIPIFNVNIGELVRALHQQCLALQQPFEIICLDDCSLPTYRDQNKELAGFAGVRYLELEENVGRARIRNRLAGLAKYPYLLYLDSDSKVVRPDYMQAYLEALQPKQVIYGGRVYSDRPPEQKGYHLHWRYGHQREALSPEKRREHPYRSFMTNNFVVPRSIFREVQFDESILRYGYEDTLYALALKKAGIEIIHLDNPLEHVGLEPRAVFLGKVIDALDNLKEILPGHPEIDTRLLRFADQLKKWNLSELVRWGAPVFTPLFKKMLSFSRTPLWILDLYKLCYFLR